MAEKFIYYQFPLEFDYQNYISVYKKSIDQIVYFYDLKIELTPVILNY